MLRQKPYAQQPEVTTDMQKRSYEDTTVELGASTFDTDFVKLRQKKFILFFLLFFSP